MKLVARTQLAWDSEIWLDVTRSDLTRDGNTRCSSAAGWAQLSDEKVLNAELVLDVRGWSPPPDDTAAAATAASVRVDVGGLFAVQNYSIAPCHSAVTSIIQRHNCRHRAICRRRQHAWQTQFLTSNVQHSVSNQRAAHCTINSVSVQRCWVRIQPKPTTDTLAWQWDMCAVYR